MQSDFFWYDHTAKKYNYFQKNFPFPSYLCYNDTKYNNLWVWKGVHK